MLSGEAGCSLILPSAGIFCFKNQIIMAKADAFCALILMVPQSYRHQYEQIHGSV